jgi:hypothetical protein
LRKTLPVDARRSISGEWIYEAPKEASSGRKSSTQIRRMFGFSSAALTSGGRRDRAAKAARKNVVLTGSSFLNSLIGFL